MGGQSYSYSDYESTSSTNFPNGYGKFYGTASSDGGGFNILSNRNLGPEEDREDEDRPRTRMYEYDELYDLSEYDGLMIKVAS